MTTTNRRKVEGLARASPLRALLAAAALLLAAPAEPAGDLAGQAPIEVKVELGDAKDGMRFVPDRIQLETGKLYRLVLVNPSPQKHYFSSAGLADAVFTRKVQVNGADGKPLAEVKGPVREIEVYPGATAEWWFVPVKAGTFGDLRCTIPGHEARGMKGTIEVR